MTAPVRHRVGRPDQQASAALYRHIIDIASLLFIDQGYLATSIEQIAAAAGSGKQTIYRRFGSKEGLFTQVINRRMQPLLSLADVADEEIADPVEALKGGCRKLFEFMLASDVISLHRIIISEVHRFPELRDAVLENCAKPLRAMLRKKLGMARAAGRIRSGEDHLDQALIAGLVTGWPVQQLLLGFEPFATAGERAAYFETAWTLLITGMAS